MESNIIVKEDLYDPVYFQVGFLNQKPHKKQIQVLRHPAHYKVILGGRRSGKTEMIAGEIIRGAYLRLYPRQAVLCPNYRHTETIYNKILSLLSREKKLGILKSYTKSPRPKIVFNNGCYIDFMQTDNPVTIRSEAYDRTIEDEANFIKDNAQAAIRPMRFDTNAPSWKLSTPWTKNSFFNEYQLGLKKMNEQLASFHMNFLDNPYISREAIEKEIEEAGGPDDLYVRTEIFGEYVEEVDMYFKAVEIDNAIEDYNFNTNVRDLDTFERHRKADYILGLDVARFGGDSTVFIVFENKYYSTDVIKVVYIEERKGMAITDTARHTQFLNHKFRFNKIYIDETGLGSGVVDTLKEKVGFVVEPVTFTVNVKQDLYSNLRVNLLQGKIKIPIHKKLIYQLKDLRREQIGESDKIKIHHSDGGHDDFPDSLALAAWHFRPLKRRFSYAIA